MPAKELNFTVDSRAMLTWGRESIKDPNTAILELVKNSYDAGATIVEVAIRGEGDGSAIVITDNGCGMTEHDFSSSWLRLGFSAKRGDRKMVRGRRKTGEKGVGRISADRLGRVLELRTRSTRGAPIGVRVEWAMFEKPNQDLASVPIHRLSDPAFVPPADAVDESDAPESCSGSGTQLRILELHDDWSCEEVEGLRDLLATLTSPFHEVRDFEIRLLVTGLGGSESLVQSPFLSRAAVDCAYSFDGGSQVSGRYSGRRIAPDEDGRTFSRGWEEFVHGPVGSDDGLVDLGPVEIRLMFYPRSKDTVGDSGLTLRELRDYLELNGGVRVYRDRIRVMPYGDPGKPEGDWLALGARKSSNPAGAGRSSYRVSPNQIVGAVFLTRDGNPELLDTSAREGLVSGNALRLLRNFILACISDLEATYHRSFKVIKEAPREVVRRSPRAAVLELREELGALSGDLKRAEAAIQSEDAPAVGKVITSIGTTTAKIDAVGDSLDELAGQATIYRGLATLGIAAAAFGHETVGDIDKVTMSLRLAIDSLGEPGRDVDAILDKLQIALRSAGSISSWGKFTLGRVRRDKRRRRKESIRQLVDTLLDEMAGPFSASGISLERSLVDVDSRIFPMDVEAILINLLSNAFYFVQKRSGVDRVVRVALKEEARGDVAGISLMVADTGPGIDESRHDLIWEPLFTTKVDQRGRSVGTGLGLAIVDSTVDEMDGERSVSRDAALGGAKVVVWIPVK